VVERLALVVYVRPGDDNGFGRWALLAGAAVIVVALAVAFTATRGRREQS
jgi:anti-sigma-K factor RskA